jgi:hypothetical protein
MRTSRRLASLVLVLSACSGTPAAAPDAAVLDDAGNDTGPRPDAATWMLDPAPEAMLMHTFPAITLDAGEERLDLCQSWTLDNTDPIYVDSVTLDAGPGWHHSNWMWVPDTQFAGPDGTFPCNDRSFNELTAALNGGGVFFAQSTQSTHEVQSFAPGAAYMIPPHARVIGAIHIFNLQTTPVDTALTFTVHGLPSTDVITLLHGLALDNRNISIAAHSTTMVDMSCNLANTTRTHRLDQHIYYVLPHYHGLATGFQLFAVGGPHDGELVFGTSTGIGDPLGSAFTVPFDLTDATGLRLQCTYQNPGADTVTWGVYRTDEMCTMLAYVDGPVQFAAASNGMVATTTGTDGSTIETSPCSAISH